MTFGILNHESVPSISPVQTHTWTDIHRMLCWNSYLHDLAKIFYSFYSNGKFLFLVPVYVLSLPKKKLKELVAKNMCIYVYMYVCLYTRTI